MTLVTAGTPLRFLGVGALNTLVGLMLIYAAKALLGCSDVVANLAGYGLAFGMGFVLHRRWTFDHDGARLPALLKFSAVVAASYVANLCVVLVAIEAGVDSYVAQALGVPVYAALAYLGLRHVAFAQRAHG